MTDPTLVPARKIVKFGDNVGFENMRTTFGNREELVNVEINDRNSQIVYASTVTEITDAELLVHLEGLAASFIEKCRFMGLNDMHISDIFYHALSGGEE